MRSEANHAQASSPTTLDHALELARRGISVFPCWADKSPRVRRGFKAATTNEAVIRGWWTRWPDALVGVPTGSSSGLLVFDIDPDGQEFILGEYGELLESGRRHNTPRGFHYLFRMPTDISIPCSAGKIAKGVDVRGDGGYIIWWPAHEGSR